MYTNILQCTPYGNVWKHYSNIKSNYIDTSFQLLHLHRRCSIHDRSPWQVSQSYQTGKPWNTSYTLHCPQRGVGIHIMSPELHNILNNPVKIINLGKSQPLNVRLFKRFVWQNTLNKYVKRLSRGKSFSETSSIKRAGRVFLSPIFLWPRCRITNGWLTLPTLLMCVASWVECTLARWGKNYPADVW